MLTVHLCIMVAFNGKPVFVLTAFFQVALCPISATAVVLRPAILVPIFYPAVRALLSATIAFSMSSFIPRSLNLNLAVRLRHTTSAMQLPRRPNSVLCVLVGSTDPFAIPRMFRLLPNYFVSIGFMA